MCVPGHLRDFIARLGIVFCCCLTLRYITWRPTNVLDLQYLFYAPFGMVFVSHDRLHQQLWPATTTGAEFAWGADLKADLKRHVALVKRPAKLGKMGSLGNRMRRLSLRKRP